MTRPLLLDLFSGAGGAAIGYDRAGFDVCGADINPMPRYPYPFRQMDAVILMRSLLKGYRHLFTAPSGEVMHLALADFSAIHASPPCQAYSVTRHSHSVAYPELIVPVRNLLSFTGLPYVIENIVGAPLREPITLCGSMFGLIAIDERDGTVLELRRHRLFESNIELTAPQCHHVHAVGGVYGGGSSRRSSTRTDWPKGKGGRGGYTPVSSVRRELMGLWHTNRDELSEAIPPAYSHYIGLQLMAEVER